MPYKSRSSWYPPFMILWVWWIAVVPQPASSQTLKVVTVNVWSGLDYRGVWRVGEYETADQREQRFQLLADELRSLDADVIALQEANPSGAFAGRLAELLDREYIHQRVNAGIKAGRIGIPVNLNEGIALLARKGLRLTREDVWDLSGTFGVFGNIGSLHFSEQNIALVGRIMVGDRPILVINTHLSAAVPESDTVLHIVSRLTDDPEIRERAIRDVRSGARSRMLQVERLMERIRQVPSGLPVIVLGDLNADADAPEIRYIVDSMQFTDAGAAAGLDRSATWDPVINRNITGPLLQPAGSHSSVMEQVSIAYDSIPRRIDHIFLNHHFSPSGVQHGRIVLNTPRKGLFASDHFGVYVQVALSPDTEPFRRGQDAASEYFPILSYDTDAGTGYGVKAFLLNHAGQQESFDLTLFNSTNGERWYRFVFSLPDIEVRQGTAYPLAVDLTVDYDKWISNSFFGIGNRSSFSRREIYTREPLEITGVLSRGITASTVLSAGLRFKTVRNSDLPDSSMMRHHPDSRSMSRATMLSLFGEYRFDTRVSYVDPSDGVVLQAEAEVAPDWGSSVIPLHRAGATLQYYATLFYPRTVAAFRLKWQTLDGGAVPVQMLTSIGGNQTLRGSPQDRFLDKTSAVVNAELRFPLLWRFGGVIGFDAGKVWSSPAQMDLVRWASNPVAGLRLVMDTFIVRMDLGMGQETTGFYLNFGHLF